MTKKYSLVELGVRTSDWEAVCRDMLTANTFNHIKAEIRKRAIKRNRETRPSDNGSCASYRPLHDNSDGWR